jgi:hypothetical protein
MVPAVAAAPLAVPAAAAAAPVVADIGMEAIVKMLGVEGLLKLVTGKVAESTAPGQYATAPVGENRSNYFIGAEPILAREQFEDAVNFKRALLGLPPIKSTDKFTKDLVDLRELQAKSLTAREMQKISLEGTLAQQLAALQGEIGLKRAGLERGYDVTLKGYDLEQEKQKQIGAIEQQKVSSTFDAAQRLLDSTITQIYGATPYARNPDLQQIATPV